MAKQSALIFKNTNLLGVCVLLLLSTYESVLAWESDFHYGLTKWLAIQAGITHDAAEVIAQGNLNADKGAYSAPHSVTVYTCFLRDENGSRLVRDKHFPTFVDVPTLPQNRPVIRNSKAARKLAEQEASRKVPGSYSQEQRSSLASLGDALHPLQDSWSHHGVPDVPSWGPFTCDRDLAWAHPSDRGGWDNHNADWTYKWTDHALAAAQATHDLLRAYAKNNTWAGPQSGKSWSAIESEVKEFTIAQTKTEKRNWFTSRGFLSTEFLNGIALEDGAMPFTATVSRRPFLSMPSKITLPTIPPQVKNFFEEFFSQWMTGGDYNKLVAGFVDSKLLAKDSGLERFSSGEDATRVSLLSWRIRDHGLVAKLGHTKPREVGLFKKLLEVTNNPDALVRYESITQAMVPFQNTEGPRFLARELGEGRYVAVGQFRHTPNDIVVLFADSSSGTLRVTALGSVVEH